MSNYKGRTSFNRGRGSSTRGRFNSTRDQRPTLEPPTNETSSPPVVKEEKQRNGDERGESKVELSGKEVTTETTLETQEKHKLWRPKKKGNGGKQTGLSSITETDFRDPWDLDIFDLVEDNVLQPSGELTEIGISAECLPTLLEAGYNEASASDKGFYQHVSPSMFEYYCYILYHQRILELRHKKGEIEVYEMATLSQLDDLNLIVSAFYSPWLDGIGDLELRDQGRIQLILPTRPNPHGAYGIIQANNHCSYETRPAPRIPTLRIRADIEYTLANGPVEWNLPADIRPRIAEAGAPTRNLIGYSTAQPLTQEQLLALGKANIDLHAFHVDRAGDRYFINTELLLHVSKWLHAIKGKFRMIDSISKSLNGSMGEIFYVE